MIRIFIMDQSRGYIYSPTAIDSIIWETHRKNRAGTISLSIMNTENVRCELGYTIELFEVDAITNNYRKILSYRIFERTIRDKVLEIRAYCQLYHLVKSKESIVLGAVEYRLIQDLERYFIHVLDSTPTQRKKEIEHLNFIKELQRKNDILDFYIKYQTSGIFPSDLILLFAKKYNLRLEYIDYSDIISYIVTDKSNYKYKQYGYHGRVTDKETPIDIIQSYIDLNTIYQRMIYVLYDGANGLCYRNITDMRTYLLYTLNEIGEYSIKEDLPEDYYNLVDFMIMDFDETDLDPHVDINTQKFETYSNEKRIQQLGIFHNHEDISSKDITLYKQNGKDERVKKTVFDVFNERKLFYAEMNETLPLTLTLNNVKGSWDVRGGSIIAIELPTFDHKKIKIEVVIERVTHTYKSEKEHTMNIEVVRVT